MKVSSPNDLSTDVVIELSEEHLEQIDQFIKQSWNGQRSEITKQQLNSITSQYKEKAHAYYEVVSLIKSCGWRVLIDRGRVLLIPEEE